MIYAGSYNIIMIIHHNMFTMYKLSVTFYMLVLPVCLNAQNNARLVHRKYRQDNSVIFRIKAPGASSVQVVGTWVLQGLNQHRW